tara:strand:+ start:404 stop:658 length:255 start_codon:yes stop_codon:yes gene_type:complete
MKNKKFEPKIIEGKVNPAKEASLKEEYQDVVDFFINTTPYQHMFFLDLIKDRLTFFNAETKECSDVDEEYQMNFNGPFLQIPIK